MSDQLHLRIFLSSPGDVAIERDLTRSLIKDVLPVEPFVRGRATFDVISWDDPHATAAMPAHLTPQRAVEAGLLKPSECDIVVGILWSRMGTPLPVPSQNLRPTRNAGELCRLGIGSADE